MGFDLMNNDQAITLDIVIPSFRADVEVLNSIRNLSIPKNMIRKIIVVLDDPLHPLPRELEDWSTFDDLSILINDVNLGAGEARNRGIDAADSDWVLFLDDDIYPEPNLLHVYAKSIEEKGAKAPGFVGITRLPETVSTFTRGIVASDILTFFDLAEHRDHMPWGVTANLLVRRDAIGNHRFKSLFPKSGGGEDIDFCFQIQKTFGARFTSTPEAVVHHPWWSNSKRRYRRAFRWGFSDTMLPSIYKEHSWRDIPNTVEIFSVFLLLSIPMYTFSVLTIMEILLFSGLIIIGEWVAEWLRQILSNSFYSPITAIESSTIRLAFALGGVYYLTSTLNLLNIGKKFDYGYNEWPKQNRKWSILRISIQALLIFLYCTLSY